MAKFYATALTQNGHSVLIDNLSDFYPTALNQAQEHCAKNNLYFQGLRPAKTNETKGNTMLKRFTSGQPTPRSKRK